jgi:hypothetical protein
VINSVHIGALRGAPIFVGEKHMPRSWERWSDEALKKQLQVMRDYAATYYKAQPHLAAEAEKHQQRMAAVEAEIARRQGRSTDH